MVNRTRIVALFACGLLALSTRPAAAGQHTWDVAEVFSNADGTIQFVELFEAGGGNGEIGVSSNTITSDAKTFSWTSTPVTNTANKRYLIATQGFADLPGAPTPDAIITADKLPFFFLPSGDAVDFNVYDTCAFPTPESVPTDGVGSFDCITDTAQATNSPTNYAGPPGSVDASAITLNYVDTFEHGTLHSWAGGSSPTNVATGGPGGVNDRYLQLSSASSELAGFNAFQWTGDYVAEGVKQIDVALNNSGTDPVNVRIMLMTPGCESGGTACTAWTSTVAAPLTSGSGWSTQHFPIAEANLTRVLGSDSYPASLANVAQLLIRHDDGAADPPNVAAPTSATLGIDNVMPEPGGPLGLAGGAALLAILARRERRRRTRE